MKEDRPHVAFARKYRPQIFDELSGQEAVSTTLKNAIDTKSIGHAYLFFGPRGVGKTTAARVLAKSLNCQKGPTAQPCGKCSPCQEIAQSSCIDVLELDAATHTQVDRIREMIIETVALAPSRDRYKIFIIDEVHMLSTASFNALLKTLEEPPGHVVFILATTEPGKIPATIVSRCQRFRFRPLTIELLKERMQQLAKSEKISIEPAAIELLARAAGGSLRDAVSLLEQAYSYCDGKISTAKVTELLGSLPEDCVLQLGSSVLNRDAAALSKALDRVLDEGYEATQLIKDLRERFHSSFLFRLGVGQPWDDKWKELASTHSPETFSFLIQRLNKTLENLRSSESSRLTLELGLFGMLEAAYDLRDWVRRLEALEERVSSGAPARPVAAGDESSAWDAVVKEFEQEKPTLALVLESNRPVSCAGAQWRVVFQRSFDLDMAQKNAAAIEKSLSGHLGRAIKLAFELSHGKPAGQAPAAAASSNPADPALARVLDVFPGAKTKQVKKA